MSTSIPNPAPAPEVPISTTPWQALIPDDPTPFDRDVADRVIDRCKLGVQQKRPPTYPFEQPTADQQRLLDAIFTVTRSKALASWSGLREALEAYEALCDRLIAESTARWVKTRCPKCGLDRRECIHAATSSYSEALERAHGGSYVVDLYPQTRGDHDD